MGEKSIYHTTLFSYSEFVKNVLISIEDHYSQAFCSTMGDSLFNTVLHDSAIARFRTSYIETVILYNGEEAQTCLGFQESAI